MNGHLTVPRNKYSIDVEKLIAALSMAETVIRSLSFDARTTADINVLLAQESSLIASLEMLAPTTENISPLQLTAVNSAMAVVQRDLGPSP